MTTIQFTIELWEQTQPIGYITVGIWIIIILNTVEKRVHGKIKGQEGQIIHPQRQGVDSIQHLYQDARLSQDYRPRRRRQVRHMRQVIHI